MDITFKMGEEMEYFDNFVNENTKLVSVQNGDKLVTTTKNSYGTWITTTKFNENFAVMVNIYKLKLLIFFKTLEFNFFQTFSEMCPGWT